MALSPYMFKTLNFVARQVYVITQKAQKAGRNQCVNGFSSIDIIALFRLLPGMGSELPVRVTRNCIGSSLYL